jgi:hypothetical protein
MWIMIAGPYRAGASDREARATNLRRLNEAAVAMHRAGHVPIIGVNMALPMIDAAGGTPDAYSELMVPISLALVERCDGCLRIGGPSLGADDEVKLFEAAGKPVYRSLADVPVGAPGASKDS